MANNIFALKIGSNLMVFSFLSELLSFIVEDDRQWSPPPELEFGVFSKFCDVQLNENIRNNRWGKVCKVAIINRQ